MTTPVRTEITGTTAHIVLCRLDSANRIDASIVRGIKDAASAIGDNPAVRAVIVRGEGDRFSAGWDTTSLAGASGPPDASSLREAGILDDPFGCLAALPQPVIVALQGEVSGGGLALALACDIRIASEDAVYSCSELAAGWVPPAGTTQRLARLVGRGNAMWMMLAGQALTALDALRIGLVTEVTPPSGLLPRAEAIANRIAERGPIAVQYAKEAVQRGLDMPLEQALRYETDLTVILQTTEDRAEGIRAFAAKDPPEFRGR